MARKKKINYTARAAHRRNEEKAAYKKEKARRAAFWKAHGSTVLKAGIAGVIVLVALILCFNWFISFDGHINMMFGQLRGVGDDWIVTNLGTTSSPSYFKLGTFRIPEGYTQDPDYSISTDKLARTIYVTPDDETSPVAGIYVSGIKESTASEMLEKVLGYNLAASTTGSKTATIDGKEVIYAYNLYDTTENADPEAKIPDEQKTGYSNIIAYMDTCRGCCLLVNISSTSGAYLDAPTEEALYPALETAVANLSAI